MTVLLFDSDLIFSSKVKGAIKRIGMDCEVVSRVEDLASATSANVQAIILNLDLFGQAYDLLHRFSMQGATLLGYYSHVNASLNKLAKEHGVTSFPRAIFISKLEDMLSCV